MAHHLAATLAASAQGTASELKKLLAALGTVLEDARVVMLGESSHGDGTTFAFKAELVKQLHLHHGFDVLAFEADFFAVNQAWDTATSVTDIRRSVERAIYPFWTQPNEIQPLWDLIEARFASDRSLIVAGIDPRPTGLKGSRSVIDPLEQALRESGLEPTHIADYSAFRGLLGELLTHEYTHKVNAFERQQFFTTLRELLRSCAEGTSAAASFWCQALRNLGYTAYNAWGFERRDEGMASNLLWLARERYPDRKLIVWAHNYHIAKRGDLVMGQYAPTPDVPYPYDRLLGDGVSQALGEAVYALGFVVGGGTYLPYAAQGNYTTSNPLDRPSLDSLEGQLLATTDFSHAFVALRGTATVHEPFTMSGVEPNYPSTLPWGQVFDGVVFIREVAGLTLPNEPDASRSTS